ncbi:uncharacterized protein [Antedon mediterranea]|uniref:uncharacterized protein isoform X2 n=1 Tax=Antedon mediterranea TaxID=105859 RepID=UPI003AF7898C
MGRNMKELLVSLLESYDQLLNSKGTPEDPHPPLAKEFFSVKSQSTKYKMQKTFPTTAGELDCNLKKNRYKDILPFDYTRVVLSEIEGIPGSDYINANYLKDHNDKPVYIAAQGPLPQTVADFWRLIWESNAQIVVMACNEYELGKHKCQKYWCEENESLPFGEMRVQQISQECITKDFLIRKLLVSKGEDQKQLFQFHYTSWPDHGVPTTVEAIINMVKKMRDYQVDGTMPLLIHCSAGCGRTGTICVIDYVRNLLRDEMIDEDFSLKSIILEMRKQRHAIVQSKEQYELVHKAAAALFRETLQNKYDMKFDDGHTYENWTIDPDLIPRPEAQRAPSIPAHQPEIPKKSQSFDVESTKVSVSSSKPAVPFKPPIPTNKPTSPMPGKQAVFSTLRTSENKVMKSKQEVPSFPVSPAPAQRRSYDSVLENAHHSKGTVKRLSDTDSKIAGVQNMLLQRQKNLTGGLQTKPPDVSKRLSLEQKKPSEVLKFQSEPKPIARSVFPPKVQLPIPLPTTRNVSGKEAEDNSSAYEVIRPELEKKVPPSKPKRDFNIQFNQQSPQGRSPLPTENQSSQPTTKTAMKLPPKAVKRVSLPNPKSALPCPPSPKVSTASVPTPKPNQPSPPLTTKGSLPALPSSQSNGEYAYVDLSSHLPELIEREKVSGTEECAAYGIQDAEVMIPYATTTIDGVLDARKPPPQKKQVSLDRTYEDITPQDLERSKAVGQSAYTEDSAYAEVGDFQQPQEPRDEANEKPKRNHFPTITLGKIFGKRPKLPDFPSLTSSGGSSSSSSSAPSQPQLPQQPQHPQQPQPKQGEHDMHIFEAIRTATFETQVTFSPGPITYENTDICFPRKVPKPKQPKRNPPWPENYSLHYN